MFPMFFKGFRLFGRTPDRSPLRTSVIAHVSGRSIDISEESGRKSHEALSAAARAAAFQMAEVKSGLFMGNGVRAPPDAFRMVQTPYGRRLGFSPIASFHRFVSVSTHYPPQNHGLRAMAVDTVYPPTSPPPPGKLPHYHSHYL